MRWSALEPRTYCLHRIQRSQLTPSLVPGGRMRSSSRRLLEVAGAMATAGGTPTKRRAVLVSQLSDSGTGIDIDTLRGQSASRIERREMGFSPGPFSAKAMTVGTLILLCFGALGVAVATG